MIENCATCVHRDTLYLRCKAFPRGIPLVIAKGQQKHTEVVAEQRGEYVWTEHPASSCSNLRNRMIEQFNFSLKEAIDRENENIKELSQ